jgi:hypothetical protein
MFKEFNFKGTFLFIREVLQKRNKIHSEIPKPELPFNENVRSEVH